jgi:3'(2'), 5'-bisphosphate nucleotidase
MNKNAKSPGATRAPQLLELAHAVAALAWQAGNVVMSVYQTGAGVDFRHKVDASPVTLADEQAEACILAGLAALTPRVPVVAEEAVSMGLGAVVGSALGAGREGSTGQTNSATSARFWLVDPLDGTREFLARNGEFTVNIALVEGGRPVLGVVLAPALPQGPVLFLGVAGHGAWRAAAPAAACRPGEGAPWVALQARTVPPSGLTVVGSRSHGDDQALADFLAKAHAGQRLAEQRAIGSSLKLCLVAEGQADLYPRLGRTMEWDTAAGQAVVESAGGRVCTLQGAPLLYGKPGWENPHFVASGLCPAPPPSAG